MEKPIRVLHVLQRMEAGGIQTFLMNIYRKIDRKKIQFDFLVHYKSEEFYDKEIYSLGGKIYKFSAREDFNLIKYRYEIRDFFASHKEYNIVHGHMETLSNIWESEARKAGIHNIICHAHTAGYNEKNYIKLLFKYYFRYTYGKKSTICLACSNLAGNFMFPKKDYKLIKNAIDVDNFKFSENDRKIIRNKLNCNEDTIVLGNVGRLHPSKNQLFILEIAKELKKITSNFKIILIGEGELKKYIEDKIEQYNLKNFVTLLGKRKDVNTLYSAMDLFIMPSLYEGLPLTGVEAQTSGLKCIFSTEITKEIKLTNLVHFLSLDDSPSFWANKIIELSKEKLMNRKKYAEVVSNSGYDINDLVKNISTFYMQLDKKGKEK